MLTQADVNFDTSIEVRSFIYQHLIDFEPFLTSGTVINVIAKDPMKLKEELELNGIEITPEQLKKKHRIVIIMTEDGAQIEGEGLGDDTIEAFIKAKAHLMKQLEEIQDTVISAQDRMMQIQQALLAGNLH